MNIDQAFAQIRPVLQIVASLLIMAGLAKLAGFGVPIKAEHWQLVIIGMGVRSV